jgi:type I restriction enzyme, S subunit
MSSFEKASLKDITNNLDNRRIPLNGSQRAEKEGQVLYPYIGANNIMGYIDDYIFDEKILCVAEDGGSWGHNQKCASIYNEKVWVNNHAHVLTAKSNLILEYLMYYLNHHDLNLHITGATRGKLTKKSLDSIQIPLPPLPVQQKIAAILDAADLHRRKTKTLIEKYDQLTQSIFLEMFGDPVKNEKGWEKYKVSALIQAVKKIDRNFSNDEIDYVDISSIDNKSNRIVSTTKYLTDERPSRAQQILRKRDVLLSMVRPNLKNIAINQFDDFIASSGFFVFRVTNKLNHHYLFELLKTDSITNKLINITAGANYPAVRGTDIKNLLIPAPPLEMQVLFSKKIENLEEQMMFAIESLHKSENLFNTLLQRAFKGELVN